MPEATIQNTAGAFGQPVGGVLAPVHSQIQYMVNNSAGALLAGDLVVCTDVNGQNATTTTTASDPSVIGVVAPKGAIDSNGTVVAGDTYAVGAIMPVVVRGPARINIAANVVAANVALASSTAAKVAAVPAAAASVAALQALVGSFIAVSMEANGAKDANNTIRCWVGKM